ncbi:MAG: hypothetical protein ACRDTO_15960 [Mycobacterium sp.]
MCAVVPVIGDRDEPQRSVVVDVPGTGARHLQDALDGVHRLRHDQLRHQLGLGVVADGAKASGPLQLFDVQRPRRPIPDPRALAAR